MLGSETVWCSFYNLYLTGGSTTHSQRADGIRTRLRADGIRGNALTASAAAR